MAHHNHEKTASDSGLIITNHRSLSAAIQRIEGLRTASQHRFLLLIEIEEDAINASTLIHGVFETHFPELNVLSDAVTSVVADRSDRVSAVLGTECDAAMFDATHHFDPALLAALASTVRGGGLLVLMTPRLENWHRRFGTRPRSRFIERFIRDLLSYHCRNSGMSARLKLSPDSASETDEGKQDDTASPGIRPGATDATSAVAFAPQGSPQQSPLWIEEQNQLLHTLQNLIRKRSCRVLVIEADRGRGKSTVLGRLGARLDQDAISWTLTSARRSAVQSVDRQWRLESERIIATAEKGGSGQAGTHLPWVPPDQIVDRASTNTPSSILFVDEAAGLPLPQLLSWVESNAVLVLATTTHGYEGCGRGFTTRLFPQLEASGIAWRRFHLTHPIRFGPHDPLEALLNDVLMLDATAQNSTSVPDATSTLALPFKRLMQDDLLADETCLRSVFGLLREAHYQTTPTDLVNLLDADELQVHALIEANHVLAVTLSTVEGDIDAREHSACIQGHRRLRDQLMPQLLARMANEAEVLSLRFRRIVRIAVAPQARRLGLGSRLLDEIESRDEAGIVAIGASYSQDAGTAAFWQNSGYQTFHEGFRPHPRSGQTTAAVLKPLRMTSSTRQAQQTEDIARLESALSEAMRILDANRQASRSSPPECDLPPEDRSLEHLSAADRRLIHRFCEGARTWHDTRGALLQLWHQDPGRREPADLNTLERIACASLPSTASRRRRDDAMRHWAREALSLSND